jgi:Ca2+-transporting ATPase
MAMLDSRGAERHAGSQPWHQRSPVDAVAALGSDADRGLTQEEAEARLKEHGKNELEGEKPRPQWLKFLLQFKDLLVILLLVATGISFGLWLHERESALPYEALAIFSIVLLNAVMGYLQEARAEKAIGALKRLSASHASVVRDGERRSVPSDEVVPGDLLLLEEGNTVPADARLVAVTALQTAEAALTGESEPVAKELDPVAGDVPLGDLRDMVFSGTAVTYGHGRAVVVATGMETQIGRIASALKHAEVESTPLQRELARLGRRMGLAVIAIALVMMGTIIVVEKVSGASALFDVLILGVALAVAAVPEGLPAVVTAVLSLGVQRMARRRAIVRHLTAVEALGSANVIASDKTGTLTKNEMTVRVVATASGITVFEGTGYAPTGGVAREGGGEVDGALGQEIERALAVADRANNAELQEQDGRWVVLGDPTEGALLVAARKAGLEPELLDERFTRVGEVPFSSKRKLMSTIHSDAERRERVLVFTKGAPDVLLQRCRLELHGADPRPLTDERRVALTGVSERLARQALRTIGVAFRELPAGAFDPNASPENVERELVFAGLIGMIDPPRDEAKVAVAQARSAGIRTMMITGDHPETAKVIARELGISQDGRVLSGTEIEKMPDEELTRALRHVTVYARVNPEHKLRIVKSLQRDGQIVAMTGDGVNDAPALKTADVGVAMGVTGTDVSKEAADIVLADDNFATIVAAVEEGRAIFSNIRKFLRYLLSSNFGEVLTMFLGVVFAGVLGLEESEDGVVVLPLLATQMLWVNLATDGAPALALGIDPADASVMQRPPRSRDESVVTPKMWAGIILTGVVTAVGTLAVLDASLPGGLIDGHGDLRYGQTRAFTTLVCFSLFTVFTSRSDDRSAFHGLFSNAWLWGAVLLSLALQLAVVYVPFLQTAFGTTALSARDWLACVAVASSVVWVRELAKSFRRTRRTSPTSPSRQ